MTTAKKIINCNKLSWRDFCIFKTNKKDSWTNYIIFFLWGNQCCLYKIMRGSIREDSREDIVWTVRQTKDLA